MVETREAAFDIDSKLVGFELQDKNDLVNTLFQIELKILFPEFAGAYLCVIQDVIYQEVEDLCTTHLDADGQGKAISEIDYLSPELFV